MVQIADTGLNEGTPSRAVIRQDYPAIFAVVRLPPALPSLARNLQSSNERQKEGLLRILLRHRDSGSSLSTVHTLLPMALSCTLSRGVSTPRRLSKEAALRSRSDSFGRSKRSKSVSESLPQEVVEHPQEYSSGVRDLILVLSPFHKHAKDVNGMARPSPVNNCSSERSTDVEGSQKTTNSEI